MILSEDQIILKIDLPDNSYGKGQKILISHFVWIGGYIKIMGTVAYYDGNEKIEDDPAFREWKFADVVAMRERMVNTSGEVVPETMDDGEGNQIPNPDAYKNEYDFFREMPLNAIIPSVTGKKMEDSVLTAIQMNMFDLWNKGKIVPA